MPEIAIFLPVFSAEKSELFQTYFPRLSRGAECSIDAYK